MHEKFMRLAIAEAQTAKTEGNYPFGAVVVQGGEVIATDRCRELTEHDVTKHAELLAVGKACQQLGSLSLADATLYASGEPCNMCASAAFQADIATVVIGAARADLPDFFRKRNIGIQQLADDASHPVEIITGVLQDEAIALFTGVDK